METSRGKKSQQQQPVVAGGSQTRMKEQRSSVNTTVTLRNRCPLVYTLLRSVFWGKYHSVRSSSHPPRAAASARTLLVTSSLYEKDMMDPRKERSFKTLSRVATLCFKQKYRVIYKYNKCFIAPLLDTQTKYPWIICNNL